MNLVILKRDVLTMKNAENRAKVAIEMCTSQIPIISYGTDQLKKNKMIDIY